MSVGLSHWCTDVIGVTLMSVGVIGDICPDLGWCGSTAGKLFCSELVAESYIKLGLIDGKAEQFSNNYTPNDFSR